MGKPKNPRPPTKRRVAADAIKTANAKTRAGKPPAVKRKISKISKVAKEEGPKRLKTAESNCTACQRAHPDYPCNLLSKGNENGKGKHRGGSYSGAPGSKKDGIESHHIPAKSSYPPGTMDSHDRKPSIQMDKADHKMTASHGNMGNAGKAYTANQNKLIGAGKIKEAFEADVKDIIELHGDKYNTAIEEARAYLDCMVKHGHIK